MSQTLRLRTLKPNNIAELINLRSRIGRLPGMSYTRNQRRIQEVINVDLMV